MKRRRRKRLHRRGNEKTGMKFVLFVVIMVGAVVCGYLTARFVVGPLLGYDTEVLKIDFPSRLENVVKEKGQGEKQTDSQQEEEKGYVLQFGIFAARDGAQTLQRQLENDGIQTSIEEHKGQYRVVSPMIETKEEALNRLAELKEKKHIDVFIDALN